MTAPEEATAARKAALRQRFRTLRRQLLAGCEASVRRQVEEVLAGQAAGAGRVGLYWPLEGEVDLRPLAGGLAGLDGRLALPAIDADRLLYRPWRPDDPLQADASGIPAPPAAAGNLRAGELGLLLVPALAVDRRGIRLGYGGGWYDRLRSHPDWRRVPALAVLPAGCLLEELPGDPWDVPFDGWISERGLEHRRS
ncbi:5-formyltetrahydrofolate cyclo-ligase [Cyanobium sp. CH-040]|uniref:5-formyltetrahydrofolate cyclo-ligase n=1 Tax=Cyanobium sp. CH-040 TaxID=2823708 RepID=UPI0020CDD035|nr:5-formyltetrahydrofolate cyclo-ligase [Cyanobium sp. CH-040]MCP9926521.1 5-formyltetrahydrofolate cyclo-ligase [Cyanobium sp. CH-040]